MGIANKQLKNFNLFVDGRGKAGNIEDLTLPKLSIKTEDFRAGGMDSSIAIDMGMEKLELSFTLTEFDADVLKLWGLVQNASKQFTIRGALESLDGSVDALVINAAGTVKEIDFSAFKAGDKSTLKITVDLRSYRYEQAGQEIYNIDIQNMVRTINGVDQLQARRQAIGVN